MILLCLNALQSLLPYVTSEPVAASSSSKLYRFLCARLGSWTWHQNPEYYLCHKLLATYRWVEKLFHAVERNVVKIIFLFFFFFSFFPNIRIV